MTLRCLLCPASAPERDSWKDLEDHLLQFHQRTRQEYLAQFPDAASGGAIPGLGGSNGSSADRVEAEQARLQALFAEKGLDPTDPRLQSAIFNLSTALIIQERISKILTDPASTLGQITEATDLYRKHRPSVKEARDTIAVLLREAKADEVQTDLLTDFQNTIREAEAFIQANQGEFFFQCLGCKTWVTTDGLPVPLLTYAPDPKRPQQRRAFLGNDETFFLLNEQVIPLHVAAFLFRTSPEGLMYTAEARGEPLEDFRNLEPHEKRDFLMDEEDRLKVLRKAFSKVQTEKRENRLMVEEKAREMLGEEDFNPGFRKANRVLSDSAWEEEAEEPGKDQEEET